MQTKSTTTTTGLTNGAIPMNVAAAIIAAHAAADVERRELRMLARCGELPDGVVVRGELAAASLFETRRRSSSAGRQRGSREPVTTDRSIANRAVDHGVDDVEHCRSRRVPFVALGSWRRGAEPSAIARRDPGSPVRLARAIASRVGEQ